MNRSFKRAPLYLALAALSLGACDCEDRVRGWVDGRSDEPKRSRVDAGAAQGESGEPVEEEPNETAGSASPIELTSELRAIRGELADPSDVDWFAVTVDRDEPWLLDFRVETDEFDPIFELDLGVGDAPPLTYDLGGEGDPEQIKTVPISRVPRRIGVRSKSGKGNYTIRLTKRLSGGAVEREPNDIPQLAYDITLPGELQGFVDRPDDRDIFAVRAAAPELVKLDLFAPAGVALVARIFGEPTFSTPLASLNVPAGGRASIPNLGIEATPGDSPPAYFLVITSSSGWDHEKAYRIRATPTPDQGGLVEREPNDEVPMKLETPAVRLGGILHAPDDVDAFAWGFWEDLAGPDAGRPDAPDVGTASTDAGGASDAALEADADADGADALWARLPEKEMPRPVVQLEVDPTDDWLQLGIKWKDDAGIAERRATVPGETVKLCARTLPTDRFRFSVRPVEFEPPAEGATGGYQLVIEQPPVESLENEPNDTLGEADTLKPGTARTGYLGRADDVDTWGTVVELPPGGDDPYATKRFEAKLEAKEHDLVVEIRDQDGGIVARVDRAGPGAGETVAVDLPQGLYYLLVRTKVGGSCEPYTVSSLQ